MAKISIIVAIYNVEKYLKKCLDSLVEQTFQEIEIIAVDDGSSDGSAAICDEYARGDSRVKALHQSNGGVSSARNLGLRRATGEWIIFVDGDDWVEPDMCEAALAAAERDGADAVLWNNFWNYPENEGKTAMFPENRRVPAEFVQRMLIDSSLAPQGCVSNATFVWGKMWRKSRIEGKCFFHTGLKWGEDQLFNLICLNQVNEAAYIGNHLYHYRINSASVTQSYKKDRLEMFRNYLTELHNYIKMYKDGDARFYDAYYKRVLYTLILANSIHFCNRNNTNGIATRARELRKLLRSEPYFLAIKKVKASELNGQRRVFAFLAKNRMSLCILLFGWLKDRFRRQIA